MKIGGYSGIKLMNLFSFKPTKMNRFLLRVSLVFGLMLTVAAVHAQKLIIESNSGKLTFCSGASIVLQVKSGFSSAINSYNRL